MSNKLSLVLLLIIILVHTFIFTKLIYFPYPELFVYPYLTNHGLKPYSQILDQHFPGLMFLPINFDNLGMNNEMIARLWSIVIIIFIHFLLFFISAKIFRNSKKALLVNFLYLIWQPFFEGWVFWIDSFLPLVLLPAFYVLYKDKIFLTGLLLGLAIVFKQVFIPLSVLVALYLLWQNRNLKTTSLFFIGLLGPIGLMLLYMKLIGVLGDFWYWTVIFNLTVYAQYGKKFAPTFAHLIRVGFVFGISILVLFFKDKLPSKDNRLIHILLIFLFGSLAGILARFDFVHFQPALPFAILATVYGLGRLGIFGYTLIAVWWLIIFYRGHLGQKVFFFDEQTKFLASKIRQYSKQGDKIFVFGAAPHLYQMADRLPAGNIFVFQFPWFLKVSRDRILEGIKNDQPTIVISDRTIEIEGQKITNFASAIDQYIQKNYQAIDYIGTTAIMRRRTN